MGMQWQTTTDYVINISCLFSIYCLLLLALFYLSGIIKSHRTFARAKRIFKNSETTLRFSKHSNALSTYITGARMKSQILITTINLTFWTFCFFALVFFPGCSLDASINVPYLRYHFLDGYGLTQNIPPATPIPTPTPEMPR